MIILILVLFLSCQVHAFVEEDYFRTSLSDETLEYAPIRPFTMEEDDRQDEENKNNVYVLMNQYLNMHNVIKSLKDYQDVCSEIEEAGNLINQAKANKEHVDCLNEGKLAADGISISWDRLVDEYLKEKHQEYPNMLKLFPDYFKNADELGKLEAMEGSTADFEEIEKELKKLPAAALKIKDQYVTWSKDGGTGDPMTDTDNYWRNWYIAVKLLQKYYNGPGTTIPSDVDFVQKAGFPVGDDYYKVPILERIKYLDDKTGGDRFYQMPVVWSTGYPALWALHPHCDNPIERAQSFAPCVEGDEGALCEVTQNLRSAEKPGGEWDRYLKEPKLTQKKISEDVSEDCKDEDGQTYLDADGKVAQCKKIKVVGIDPLTGDVLTEVETKVIPKCEAEVEISWELNTKNGGGETWSPQIFHNRFEDYDRMQISLFRAYENKRNLIRIAKVMAQNIRTNLEFLDKNSLLKRPGDSSGSSGSSGSSSSSGSSGSSSSSGSSGSSSSSGSSGSSGGGKYEGMACDTLGDELKELESWQGIVKEALDKLEIPDGVKPLKKALDDNAGYGKIFLSYQNKEEKEIQELKQMSDFIDGLPNATQVFQEDDSIYRNDLDSIWGPEIYWTENKGNIISCP